MASLPAASPPPAETAPPPKPVSSLKPAPPKKPPQKAAAVPSSAQTANLPPISPNAAASPPPAPLLGPDGQPLPVLRRRVFLAQDDTIDRNHHARHHYPPRDRDSRPDRAALQSKESARGKPTAAPLRQQPAARPQETPSASNTQPATRGHKRAAALQKRTPEPPPPPPQNAKPSKSAPPKPSTRAARPHQDPPSSAVSSASASPHQSSPSAADPGVLPAVNPEHPSAHATTWWGRRWIEAIEHISTTYANRLVRGLKYAQQHRVRNLKVVPGKVEVQIAGQRRAPYRVSIQLKALTASQWNKIVEVLSGRAAFAASLLAGEMPEALAGVFEQCGLPLFPQRMGDIKASCSCPDWANPCKHIAAAHIAVAEALDADPFMLLSVRGRNQEQLLADLRTARSGEDFDDDPSDKDLGGVLISQLDPSTFFVAQDDFSDYRFSIARPDMPMPLLRRLGDPARWSAPLPLASAVASIYDRLSELAARIGTIEMAEPDLDDDSDTPSPPQPTPAVPPPRAKFVAIPDPMAARAALKGTLRTAPTRNINTSAIGPLNPNRPNTARATGLARASRPATRPPQPSQPTSPSPSDNDTSPNDTSKTLLRRAPHTTPTTNSPRTDRTDRRTPPPPKPQPPSQTASSPNQNQNPNQNPNQNQNPPKAPRVQPPPPKKDPQPSAPPKAPPDLDLTLALLPDDTNDARQLSRRVAPGSTDADPSASLLDARLEMIIPITETEATPNGPHIARQIIWALRTHGAATARQLARRTRLKKTSVVQILQGLLAVGIVSQEGQGERARFAAKDN